MLQQLSSLREKRTRVLMTLAFSLVLLFLLLVPREHLTNAHGTLLLNDRVAGDSKVTPETSLYASGQPDELAERELQHWLVGSYYSTENGLKATLLLNNKDTKAIEVRPTLYNLGGQELSMAPLSVEANSFRLINLQEWTQQGGESFQSGSIKLFHKGKDIALGAQIYLTDENHSLSFEEKLGELGKFDSRQLAGVWMLPPAAEVDLVLSNTSDAPLAVTAQLAEFAGQTIEPRTVALEPHETRLLNVGRDFSHLKPFASGAMAVTLEHQGAASDLIGRALVRDSATGYSMVVPFTNPKTGKSQAYHGAGLKLGHIGAERLTPVVAVYNAGSQESRIAVKVPYTKANDIHKIIELPKFSLQSGEIKLVDMRRVIETAEQETLLTAGIEIEYDTPAGSIVTQVQSISDTKNYAFRVLMWDAPAQRSSTGGYPWSIQDASATKTFIKNVTDREQDYVAFLTYNDNQMYILGMKTIAPHQTIEIDVKKLRDEQIPDTTEHYLPLDVTQGQLQWTLRQREPDSERISSEIALVGQMEQTDTQKGLSSVYFCQNCCNGNFSSGYLTPGDTLISNGDVIQYTAFERAITCYTQEYTYPIYNADWESGNISVATVNNSGVVTGHGSGQTQIRATWRSSRNAETNPCGPSPYTKEILNKEADSLASPIIEPSRPACGSCFTFSAPVSGATNVGVAPNVEKIQYRVGNNWVDMPAGDLGPICHGANITFRAVAVNGANWPSSRPIWTGEIRGTGREIPATFNNSGIRTISASSGNTITHRVNVGSVNNPVPITWRVQGPNYVPGSGDSTTVRMPPVPVYSACADPANDVWRLRVNFLEENLLITITTGGYRDPDTNPPVNQMEASDAVNTMNDYYINGTGAWHTSAATLAHERHHESEIRCTAEHFWPPTENALEILTVPYSNYSTELAAITALRDDNIGMGNIKFFSYRTAVIGYYNGLSDAGGDRPYAAGQLVLNTSISRVQGLAMQNGWTVAGITHPNPTTMPICYNPWPTYNP